MAPAAPFSEQLCERFCFLSVFVHGSSAQVKSHEHRLSENKNAHKVVLSMCKQSIRDQNVLIGYRYVVIPYNPFAGGGRNSFLRRTNFNVPLQAGNATITTILCVPGSSVGVNPKTIFLEMVACCAWKLLKGSTADLCAAPSEL